MHVDNVLKSLISFKRRLECLQSLDVEKFVRLNSALGVNLKPNEDAEYALNPFLPMSPMEALRTGNYNKNVTVIIGSNEDDGLILTTPLTTDPALYILYRYTLLVSSSRFWCRGTSINNNYFLGDFC